MSSDLAIRVRGLCKSYSIRHEAKRNAESTLAETVLKRLRKPLARNGETETFHALKDVDFDVKKGDVVGIIGRNGAGKSTLLKILSRITEPTSGRIELYGRIGSLLEVGTGFHPELTGRENVYLNGAILGMSRDEIRRQFDAIVDFAEVENFLDTPVKRYSSGMYVRLAFAVAAHLRSDILILDEVLAVGDSSFQNKCMGKMSQISGKEGRTVLFVSHNMAAIQQLCTSALLLRSGQIVFTGSVSTAGAQYFGDASSSEGGRFDLGTHSARTRTFEPLIRRVDILTEGTPTAKLHVNAPIVFRVTLNSPRTLYEPRFAIAVEDSVGRRITTAASYFDGNKMQPFKGEAIVDCALGKLSLGAGRYLFSVSVSDKIQGLLDSVDGAGWFEIEWNNDFKNGEPYSPVYGPVLTKSKWQYAASGSTFDR